MGLLDSVIDSMTGGHLKQRKMVAGFVGTQMLLDSFEIPKERQEEISKICDEISKKHAGNPPESLKEMCGIFKDKELAYVMYRMGINTGLAFSRVFGTDIPSSAEW